MFAKLPDTTFIWKYEVEDAEFSKTLSENVFLKKWIPQPALLGYTRGFLIIDKYLFSFTADPRLNLFITHGGLGSTLEVAYAGKPSLMVNLSKRAFHSIFSFV